MESGKYQDMKKLNSRLIYYYKNNIKICLKINLSNSIIIRGFITKKNSFGMKYIIMKPETKSSIKIFLSEIEPNSVIPTDYEKRENKNINQRQTLNPKLRWKILKRDKFTCQGCGKSGRDQELEVDHKVPISRGGTDDEKNLQTFCRDCNRGKSDTQ